MRKGGRIEPELADIWNLWAMVEETGLPPREVRLLSDEEVTQWASYRDAKNNLAETRAMQARIRAEIAAVAAKRKR